MKKGCLISLILLNLTLYSYAQEADTTAAAFGNKLPFGISVRLSSLIAGGVSFDAFVTDRLNIEVAGSLLLAGGAEGGLNYHLCKKPVDLYIGNWSPYVGIHAGYYELHFLTRTNYTLLYFPVGIHHLGREHFSIAIDLGYSLQNIASYRQGDFEPYKTELNHLPHGRIKIGYRF